MGRQQAVLLRADGQREALLVPCPPADTSTLQPQAYLPFLPGADPQHLLLAAVPFSEVVGRPALLVYDEGSGGASNAAASRLTTNPQNGLALEVRGDALALFARPGKHMSPRCHEEPDNAIYDELLEYFKQGRRPTQGELDQLVDDYLKGRFAFSRLHEGQEDEDGNKDDGGTPLAEAVAA